MKTFILLPHRYKTIGSIMLITACVFAIVTAVTNSNPDILGATMPALIGSDASQTTSWFTMVHVNLTYTLTAVLFIVGGLLLAFARETREDEYIMHLRLSAFQWSVFANYALLLVLFLTVYGIDFLLVLSYNLYTVLLLFIARFHYLLYIKRKSLENEK